MTMHLPIQITDADGTWQVSRAWPGADGSFPVELRSGGDVRGAFWEGGTLRALPVGADPRLPGLAVAAAGGRVVSHRPGKRAVVRTDDGAHHLKVVRPGRAADVVTAHERASVFGQAFAMPELVRDRAAEADGIVRFTTLSGRTLHDLGADPSTSMGQWQHHWRQWATAWTALLAAPADADLPAHDADAEARVVRTWAAHAASVLPAHARRLHDAADALTAALAADAGPAHARAHRDLHDKQLLGSQGPELGIIDLDTVSRAEPELDLANLRAHAAFRETQGVWTTERASTVREAVDTVATDTDADPARLRAYEQATMFRLGCLYLYRPRWRQTAQALLDALLQD